MTYPYYCYPCYTPYCAPCCTICYFPCVVCCNPCCPAKTPPNLPKKVKLTDFTTTSPGGNGNKNKNIKKKVKADDKTVKKKKVKDKETTAKNKGGGKGGKKVSKVKEESTSKVTKNTAGGAKKDDSGGKGRKKSKDTPADQVATGDKIDSDKAPAAKDTGGDLKPKGGTTSGTGVKGVVATKDGTGGGDVMAKKRSKDDKAPVAVGNNAPVRKSICKCSKQGTKCHKPPCTPNYMLQNTGKQYVIPQMNPYPICNRIPYGYSPARCGTCGTVKFVRNAPVQPKKPQNCCFKGNFLIG